MNNTAKTAKKRKALSAPMKWIASCGFLQRQVLDFGCGRGDDVRNYCETYPVLSGHLTLEGYDPNVIMEVRDARFHSDKESLRKKYDVITCIYVLNVVEFPEDRLQIENEIIDILRPGGRAFIVVRDDVKKEGITTTGTWQGMVTPTDRWHFCKHFKGKFRVYDYVKPILMSGE